MTHGVHEELGKLCDEGIDQVIGRRRHLHRNPELPNREAATARLVARELAGFGLDEVRTGDGRQSHASSPWHGIDPMPAVTYSPAAGAWWATTTPASTPTTPPCSRAYGCTRTPRTTT